MGFYVTTEKLWRSNTFDTFSSFIIIIIISSSCRGKCCWAELHIPIILQLLLCWYNTIEAFCRLFFKLIFYSYKLGTAHYPILSVYRSFFSYTNRILLHTYRILLFSRSHTYDYLTMFVCRYLIDTVSQEIFAAFQPSLSQST